MKDDYFLYFRKCLLDPKVPPEEGGTNEIQSIPVVRENEEMVSFLCDAIFLCPKLMKEKGKLAGGGRRARAVNLFFAVPSMNSYVFVSETIPLIGPSFFGSVGETDRWVDTSLLVSCSMLSQ